ncbi:diacylglycerol kinase family protein [Candidatus Daviesbacteria bacterium]|nr:diacylglycerol kinase family protein [Candidatus Daviesbacteria bacterium]
MEGNHNRYHTRILSFKYAFEGIYCALKEEPNLKFHALVAILVIAAGSYFQISKTDWVELIILIGLVISLELTNTAIETVVDSLTQAAHPGAKMAKDIAAGAVLVISITAAIAGVIIFLPYVSQ